MVIEYGDILGVQGSGWLSDHIRSATGNGPLSHIAIITATVPFVQVTEALEHVVTRSWEDRLLDATHLWVLKSPLSEDDRVEAVRRVLKHSGAAYPWWNIAMQLADSINKTEWFTEHFVNIKSDNVICSELAAVCEDKLGLRADDPAPNDFWGWWGVESWPRQPIK